MRSLMNPAGLLLLTATTFQATEAATVDWIDASGFWDVAANWDIGVPQAADDAVIDVAGTHTITVRATGGPFAVNSVTMTGDERLAIAGGSLSLGAESVVNALTHSQGVLGGAGNLIVTGPATLAFSNLSSVMTGPATTTLRGATAIGGYAVDNGRILRNEGTVSLTGSIDLNRFDDGGAGRIDNAAGALFDIRTFNLSIVASAHADRDARPGFPAFNNAGTLRRSTTGNTYTIAVPVNNTGTIEVLTGNLNLSGGGTHDGAATMAAGTTLVFGGGTHEVLEGASFTGDGTLQVGGNAIVDFKAPTVISSVFNHNTGVVKGADLLLEGPSTLAFSNLTSVMTGPATTTLRGATAIGSYAVDNGRILRNEGTVTLTGGMELNRYDDGGAGRIDNAAGALFDIRTFNQGIRAEDHDDLRSRAGFPAFNNAGTLRKSTGIGTYGIAVPFTNAGEVEVLAGQLAFTGHFGNGGILTVAAGTTLSVVASEFESTGILRGHGSFAATGGPLVSAGTIAPGTSIGTLTITGGLEQTAAGTLAIEIASLAEVDRLDVLGNVALDGTLHVIGLDGYDPEAGDSFTILSFDDGVADASDLTGAFSNLLVSGFAPGVGFTVSYLAHSVVLNATVAPIPLPAAGWLLAPALGILAAAVRRRR